METTLQPYNDFAPTAFDNSGAFLPDRQGWLVCAVSQSRDSGTLDQSNFASHEAALKDVDPDGDDHETHRFGHWGPGWFEIILVRAKSTAHTTAEDIASALSDYPVLDDEDFSEREYEEACEAWLCTNLGDRVDICRDHSISIFAARRDEIPQDLAHYEDFYCPQ